MKPKSLELHEKHKKGICPHCGNENDRFPKWYCSTCLEQHNRWAREYNKIRRSSGICPRCGGNMKINASQCVKCVEKTNIEVKKAREARKVRKAQVIQER